MTSYELVMSAGLLCGLLMNIGGLLGAFRRLRQDVNSKADKTTTRMQFDSLRQELQTIKTQYSGPCAESRVDHWRAISAVNERVARVEARLEERNVR